MAIKEYRNLQYEDRCQIYVLLRNRFSRKQIAGELGFHPSTIGRELKRNIGKRGYRYRQAQMLAKERRSKASRTLKKMNDEMIAVIEKHLCSQQWSPEQIAGRLKLDGRNCVSHERIYQHILRDKSLGGTLYKSLRRSGKKYNKRQGKNAGRGLIPNRVDIDMRPAIVAQKSRVGDWELDTIIGSKHVGAIVSMVDRASKYTKLRLVRSKHARPVSRAIRKALRPLNGSVKTLTADNGKEFAMHEKISADLNAAFYFAKPYHSWERGLNEHTNGLVRQYFPKKMAFDTITQRQVQDVENLLNSRPRKVLNFRTPMEAFLQLTKIALQS